MTKKIIILTLIIVLAGILTPSTSEAVANVYKACNGIIQEDGTCSGSEVTVCYEGFVPCGKMVIKNGNVENGKCEGGEGVLIDCQLCHIFIMINNIVSFLLINIVPPLAVLMIVIGGVMFYAGGGKPDLIDKAKKLLLGVVIGLFLIYGAYLIIGLFLSILGATNWQPFADWADMGVFSINCPLTF